MDTLSIARRYVDTENHKLGTLAEYYNITISEAHRAESDAETCGKILWHLLDSMEVVVKREEERKRKKEEQTKKKAEEQACKKAEREAKAKESVAGKAVLQMDDDGNIIAEYVSINSASAATGIYSKCISDTANGRQKHAGGFVWKFKDAIE